MKSAVITSVNNIHIEERVMPSIGVNEVLIKIRFCGICATDVMILKGIYSQEKLPLVPGHEFYGEIASVDKSVTHLNIGDVVTVDINVSCGCCRYCKQNQPLLCSQIRQIGIHEDGGFAEFIAVPANKVVPISGHLNSFKYALVEPVSAVIRSVRAADPFFGRSATVAGEDFMALLYVKVARMAGAFPLIMTSDNSTIRDSAQKLGADGAQTFGELRDGRKFSRVVEMTGRSDLYAAAQQGVDSGGTLVAFGLAPQGETVSYEPFSTVLREQNTVATVAGAGIDVFDAVSLIENRLDAAEFPLRIISLEDAEEGLRLTETATDGTKVIIDMSL